MITTKLLGYSLALMTILLLIASGACGYNWWRKNVYYDALHIVAANKSEQARGEEQRQREALDKQRFTFNQQRDLRNEALQKQLDAIADTPASVRVEYRLRDRFLPTTCPASGAEAEHTVGLSQADERFLVRLADECDAAAAEANYANEQLTRLKNSATR